MQNQVRALFEPRVKIALIFTLALLFVEETIAVYVDPVLGLFVAFLGVFTTALLPYITKSVVPVKTSLECFSLIFLSRVAVAVIPALILTPPFLLITVYSVVIAFCAIYALERGLTASSLGFHLSNVPIQVFAGLIMGVAMSITEYAILSSDMKTYLLFQGFSIENFAYVTMIMFLFVALGEELLFRGLFQTLLEKEFGSSTVAIIIVSLAFALMHIGYVTSLQKILEILYVFVVAVIIGYAFTKTKSLLFPVIAHGLANTILFGILPYLQ